MTTNAPARPTPAHGLSVHWAAHGRDAEEALLGHVEAARADDPLARVTVVVPNRFEALTLRRRAAARPGGTVGVQFETLDDLATQLAMPLLARTTGRPLTDDVHDLLVGEAARSHPGALGALADNPATISALSRAVATLRAAVADTDPEPTLAALAAGDVRATGGPGIRAALATTYREYRRLVGTDHHDRHDVALTAATADAARVADVAGVVLVHLPSAAGRPATPDQARLLQRLAHHTSVTILAGRSGDAVADADTAATVSLLAGRDVVPDTPGGALGAGHDVEVVVVPDAHEEVRTAARLVTEALHEGVDPADLQVLYLTDDPYASLLTEALTAADLPHHGPSTRRLGQTVVGRVLEEAWTWHEEDHPRARLLDLLGSTPVRARGRAAPAGAWDRVARRAGVVGGRRQWDRRLAGWADRTAAEAHHKPDWLATRLEGDAATARELRTFALSLADDLAAPGVTTWRGWGEWALDLLDGLLGTDRRSWSDDDREAEGEIRQRLAALAHLDDVRATLDLDDRPVDRATFRRLLRRHLDTPSGRVGRAGVGVRVARLAEAGTSEVSRTILVGAVEGALPPRPRSGPFLPDDVVDDLARQGITPPADGHVRVRALRRALARVLATSATTTLVVPRVDRREQRPARPGPWVLEVLATGTGRPVGVDDVLEARPAVAGHVRRVDSAVAGILAAAVPAGPAELELRALADHVLAGGDLRDHPLASEHPGLVHAADVVAARRSPAFTAWDGNLVELGDRLVAVGEQPQSPNGLAAYGQCPRSWLFDRGLRIRAEEPPRRWLDVDALDRGNLVHHTLEDWIRETLDDPAGDATTGSDRPLPPPGAEPGSAERLRELFDHHGDALEAAGRTGLVALWRQQRRHLWRLLDRWRGTHDDLVADGWVPDGVEVAFGLGGGGHQQVATDDLTFTFRGQVDRMDVLSDGEGRVREVAVWDYKTAKPDRYRGLDDDVALAGRELQLPVYGLVAQARHPDARVSVGYWHVHDRAPDRPLSVPFDDRARARTDEVLGAMAAGIRSGVFPPEPGKESLWPAPGFEHCRWCPFTTICPSHGARQREADRAWDSPEAAVLLPLVESEVLADGDSAGGTT